MLRSFSDMTTVNDNMLVLLPFYSLLRIVRKTQPF